MSKFSKSLNPRNIDKSFSDIQIRIRFTFEGSFWTPVSGCKLTILPDIQPANRIVIISDLVAWLVWAKSPDEETCPLVAGLGVLQSK